MRAKPLTESQKQQILSMYDKHSCVEISNKLNVTLNQVYDLRKRLKITNKQNLVFEVNEIQNQILLSGKLGDGNYKSNGKYNAYYRESHASDELGYLKWKANELKNMLSSKGIIKINIDFNNNKSFAVQQPYYFMTKTSPTFANYQKLSIDKTISKLNEKGLIMFMLDDGWYTNHLYKGNFCISGGRLTLNQMESICSQFEKFNIRNVHIIGKVRQDFYIPSENNNILYEIATSFIPKDTDIIIKKFKK